MPFQKGQSGNVRQVFTSQHQPANRGRKKGVPNRATVFKRLLKLKTKVADPSNPKGASLEVDLYTAAALGQILSAMKGNTRAWAEIQDTLHGKIPQPHEVTGRDGEPLTILQIIQKASADSQITEHESFAI
jgi:hypothetical protein